MRIINQTISRGRNKTQKQYEHSMWEKHAFTYVGIVENLDPFYDDIEKRKKNKAIVKNLTDYPMISTSEFKLHDSQGLLLVYNFKTGEFYADGEPAYDLSIHLNSDIIPVGYMRSLIYVSGNVGGIQTSYWGSGSQGALVFTNSDSSLTTSSAYESLRLYFRAGTVFTDYKFKLQLEDNSSPTEYVIPFIEGLSNSDLPPLGSVGVKLIPSISYDDYDMKKGFTKINTTNKVVSCLKVEGIDLQTGDVVLVVFTDLDSRRAIQEISQGRNKKDNYNIDNPIYHDFNFGIIINKIII